MIAIVLVSAHTFLLGMLLGMWPERRKRRDGLSGLHSYPNDRSARLNVDRPPATWSISTEVKS